jgi:hypothetical protein
MRFIIDRSKLVKRHLRTKIRAPQMRTLLVAVTLLAISPATGREYRLCVGEFDEKCPVSHNVSGGCGANADAIADATCAIRLQGEVKHIPYRLIHQGTHEGNRCGYEWYSIECLDDFQMPPSGNATNPPK